MSQLFVLLLSAYSVLSQDDLPTKATTGILFKETSPLPIFHEKVASIIYNFATPTWSTLWIPPYNGTFCPNDVYNETAPFYHCPVDFHQAIIERHVYPSLTIENFKVKSSSMENVLKDCNQITKSIRSQYLDIDRVENYLSGIRNCSNGYYSESEPIQDHVTFNIGTTHQTLRDRYKVEFGAKLVHDLTDRHRMGTLVLNTKITNDVGMFHYHVESLRWKQAQTDCNMGIIPRTLVTPSRLNQSLFDMKAAIVGDHYELSLSESYLSTYYTLPFAECVFTDNSFIVHVQVPIQKEDPWSLVTATQVPIYDPTNESICLVPISSNNFLFQPTTSTAFESSCSASSKLCGILEATERPLEKSCGSATLLMEDEYIPELCQLECKSKSRYQLPIFRKVGSDTFTITGDPGQQVVIQCDTRNGAAQNSVQVVELPEEGAIEVVLGCYCQILYESIEITAQWPCGTEAIVSHLVYAYDE